MDYVILICMSSNGIKSLRQYLAEAQEQKRAIGHFNVSDLVAFQAIVSVAKERNIPVIIGTSEGERGFIGAREIAALVRAQREKNIPVFLNADHTHSFEKIQEAVEAGYDAVLFDWGAKHLDENITETKKVVAWVREYNREHGTDVLVEGELGYIGTSSTLLDEVPEGAAIQESQLTSVADLKKFVEETGVDLVAPAVGNVHGMLKSGAEPALHIPRIKELAEATDAGFVLHGASGNTDEQLRRAVEAGVRIVHVNTELRVAWKRGFELAFLSHQNEIVPYKILPDAIEEVRQVVEKKISLIS
jgi:fructose-bisphosphate aldolase class II